MPILWEIFVKFDVLKVTSESNILVHTAICICFVILYFILQAYSIQELKKYSTFLILNNFER